MAKLPDLVSRDVPIHRILAWGVQSLQEAGIPTARLDAEVLMGAVLGLSRTQVLTRSHTTMLRHPRGHYVTLIQRRLRGEPVAYMLGRKEFYGRDFFVDRRVLIPRPETEELVDRCLDVLEGRPAPRVADIGTGSGAIAVTLAAERPDATIIATDVSADALTVAENNARRYQVNLTFRQGSLLEPLQGELPFDLIVANLPYVGTDEAETLSADVRDFEPHTALFAGADGTALFPLLFEQVNSSPLLKADGVLLLEIGYAQGPTLLRLARRYFPEARTVAVHQDLAKQDRFLEVRP